MSIPGIGPVERVHSHVLQSPLAAPRRGVMLHYDNSSRDDWAVAWFSDPRCTNGYTWLVLDDGRVVELADPLMRTPHAGPCRTRLANSVFYGIAAATNGLVPATEPQLASIVRLCVALFRYHAWPHDREDAARAHLVGHDEEAIWTPAYTRRRDLWGRLGRKVDPTGQRKNGQPIVGLAEITHRILNTTI